ADARLQPDGHARLWQQRTADHVPYSRRAAAVRGKRRRTPCTARPDRTRIRRRSFVVDWRQLDRGYLWTRLRDSNRASGPGGDRDRSTSTGGTMKIEHPYAFVQGSTPLLISMPHPGLLLPDPVAELLTSEARGLPDTDWHIPQL